MIIYPGLEALRQFYSVHIKKQVEEENNMVVFAPFYETTDYVRTTLSSGNSAMDVSEHEKGQSLTVMDAAKVYRSEQLIPSFMETTINYAKRMGKSGVTFIGDTGAFHYMLKRKELVEYELSLPRRFGENRKVFCLYHQRDFDRLSKDQKQKLLEHHGRVIKLQC
ncbi:MAG: MEDS domain-containing protein [Thermoproteota archaeon]|nr:MEDS domain-containing protein [Thermoproteota archaeon]